MKRTSVLVLIGAGALAACAENAKDNADLPSAPGAIVAAKGGIQQPPGCSFKDAKAFARDYFLVNTTRQAVNSAFSAAEGADVGSEVRNNALFSVLSLVAGVGGDPAVAGPPVAGANLVGEVVDCGPMIVTDNRGFQKVLISALTDGQGEFAIRGITDEETYVEAESHRVAIGPNVGKDPWIDQVGRVAVFLGLIPQTADDPPPPNFGGLDANLVAAYRIGLIYEQGPPRAGPPDFSDDDYFAVEFCNFQQAGNLDKQRVGRSRGANNTQNTVLQQSDIAGFCNVNAGSFQSSSRSLFARALDRLGDFLLPTPLQAVIAAAPPWSGSTGGLESDFGVVQVPAVTVTVPTIPGGVKGQPVNFTFTAFTGPSDPFNTIPLENVVFTVTVSGNQGDPVVLTSGNSGTTCDMPTSCWADTNELGAAGFSVIFDKAGGYTLEVKASFSGFDDIVRITNLFIIAGN